MRGAITTGMNPSADEMLNAGANEIFEFMHTHCFPRDLAIPELLRCSAWVMLSSVMNASLTAFPQRGLSPHQFTPMSGAHERPGADAEWRALFAFQRPWPRAAQAERYL